MKTLLVALLSIAAISSLTACSLRGGLDKEVRTGQTDLGFSQGPGSIGIKTAPTLIASFERVTGVSADAATFVETISGNDTSLSLNQHVALSMGFMSKSSEIESFNSTHLLVACSLGSAFAREQIRKEVLLPRAQRTLTGDIDFSQQPVDALAPPIARLVIGKFSQRYLQRAPEDEELSTLLACVSQMIGDFGSQASGQPRSLANQQIVSSCIATSFLCSPDFLRQ